MMSWDEWIFRAINRIAGQGGILDWVMVEASRTDDFFIPLLLAVGYWCWTNWREARIGLPTLGLLFGGGDFLGAQLKWVMKRPRPCQVLSHIHELTGCGGTFSLPSNHALNSATIAAFLHMVYPRTGWVAWPLVACIGISRVYVGAHYVTDVLWGWGLGGVLGAGGGWLLLRSRLMGRQAAVDPVTLRDGPSYPD